MANKPKKAETAKDEKLIRKHVQVEILKADSEEEKARKFAGLLLSPELAAYRVVNSADGQTSIYKQADVPSLVKSLRDQAAAINRGEMNHIEAMLLNQATGLQSLFARMTERANEQSHMPNLEGFMRIALRAQNQCRATLETLAAIKNPPVVFTKQANINQGNGNQQVNNCTTAPVTHAEKNIIQQNELLEVQHGSEKMDTRAKSATGSKDKAMATVG